MKIFRMREMDTFQNLCILKSSLYTCTIDRLNLSNIGSNEFGAYRCSVFLSIWVENEITKTKTANYR